MIRTCSLSLIAIFLLRIGGSAAGDTPILSVSHPWKPDFAPPAEITSSRVYLEPLTPDHTALDFAAVKSSSDHLRETLQWGNWPPADMSIDDNRIALENHWTEFENHEAYAYTVLSPDKNSCLGCIYLNPSTRSKTSLSVIFWVRADQLATGLDIHLVETIIAEVQKSWPVDVIEFPIPSQNRRGLEILTNMSLRILETTERQTVFEWERPSLN